MVAPARCRQGFIGRHTALLFIVKNGVSPNAYLYTFAFIYCQTNHKHIVK